MNALLEWLKPYARAVKYALFYRRARRQAERDRPGRAGRPTPPLAFIFACGRSGTTVLGKIFAAHPDVRYLFEPYHSWAAIDPRTDMLQLYVESDGRCLMDAADVNENIRTRFRRVIREANADPGVKLVMEKTPINALRLGYLMELAPDAKFIHIVRDGVDVARSIARLATAGDYRIAGKALAGKWWGVGGCKWRFLARDGAAAGYYAGEVTSLSLDDEFAKGAYEWLLSLHEVDRHRAMLGDRLFEFTYERLTEEPEATLRALCAHVGIEAPQPWLNESCDLLDEARSNPGKPESLPPRMAASFNTLQERFGFHNRVKPRPIGTDD